MIMIERVCMTITVRFQFMLSYTEEIEKKIELCWVILYFVLIVQYFIAIRVNLKLISCWLFSALIKAFKLLIFWS